MKEFILKAGETHLLIIRITRIVSCRIDPGVTVLVGPWHGVVENSPGKGKRIMKASPNFRLRGVKDGIYGGDHVLVCVLLIITAKAGRLD